MDLTKHILIALTINMDITKNQTLNHIQDEKKKNHKCETCVKSFSRTGSFKEHINSVHNGQKDHKCGSCGKSFSQAGSLKIHINAVHNGLKDHKCDSCGKEFSQAGNLKTHKCSSYWAKKS